MKIEVLKDMLGNIFYPLTHAKSTLTESGKTVQEVLDSTKGMISDEWNQTTTYKAGDYVIYNNTLWKCLVDNTEQTPQEGTYWTERKVATEFAELNSKTEVIIKTCTIVKTVGAGASVVFNLSEYVPEGYRLRDVIVTSGIYKLPYFTSSGTLTCVSRIYNSENKVEIYNTATAWNDYGWSFTMFLEKKNN